ncbi:cellulose synthase catalytic subunit [Streptomyces sp. NPDC001876]|uniref:glycosyltransferase family 2 protein n=1 Tax=Streptomyces sp. NPDC001876 TaxID=3154402 RepID=UPI00331A6797
MSPSVGIPTRSTVGGVVPSEGYDYAGYSRLAGPLTEPAATGYRVECRSLLPAEKHRTGAVVLMALAPVLTAILLFHLLRPTHRTERGNGGPWPFPADMVVLVPIGLIGLLLLVDVVSIVYAMTVARDPVPVMPEPGTRVAFLTTYVPGKEPLAMVRATLKGAVAVRHSGPMDVWLLDEGDDPGARMLCAELGVHHFTRSGVPEWNRAKGPHRARTKHGNYNAWIARHGGAYDFFASVDTDHVPQPNFLERMLGYFRDPDTAFVVGPQVYGNYEAAVTKWAESQQVLFHALIQRAGNRYGAPVLVGTNNVVRIAALRQAGGLHDSITEDLATGFEIHRHRNPLTGRHWRSVYTPDVLAVGEGPASWTDFFTQQLRWSRGTYETMLRQYGRALFRVPPGRLLSYTLMFVHHSVNAVSWLLGVLSCTAFLWLGAPGTQVTASLWLLLCGEAAALRIGLYLWNRRHNVSPHEPEGSGGLAGMAMSALCAPVHLKSLGAAVLRTDSRFVVTPKGGSASTDRLRTFRLHLVWAALLLASLVASVVLDHTHAVMRTWAAPALVIALAPVAVWSFGRLRERRAGAVRPAGSGQEAEPALVTPAASTPAGGNGAG